MGTCFRPQLQATDLDRWSLTSTCDRTRTRSGRSLGTGSPESSDNCGASEYRLARRPSGKFAEIEPTDGRTMSPASLGVGRR